MNSRVRVADYLVERLYAAGVRTAFLLTGGGMMHLVDALGRRRGLKLVFNHHEHASAVGAEGYSRQSGGLGACFATSGPGSTNILTGLVECWQDSVPVIFVTGQSKVSQTIQGSRLAGLRQFGTFEVDIIPMVRSVTKYAAFVDHPSKIRPCIDAALAAALSGRPGPVLLDIPVDIQGAPVEFATFPETLVNPPLPPSPTLSDAAFVLRRLSTAKRPLILAGHGIRAAGAVDLFRGVLRRLNVPCVTTQLAADVLEYRSPLFVGRPGVKGDRAGNFAIQSADCIISLGSSLHVMTTGYELDRFAPKAFKIQVDLDEWILKREGVGVSRKIRSGASEFLSALGRRLPKRRSLIKTGQWHERCRSWKLSFSPSREKRPKSGKRPEYYAVLEALNDLLPSSATLVTDAGSAFYVVGQAIQPRGKQRVLTSGAMGAMGHALPMAIGAAYGGAGTVVCLTGDGSLQTNIQEFATLVKTGVKVCVVVVNNGGYVSISNTQRNFFEGFLVGTNPATGVVFPSLKKIASAYGLKYIRISTRKGLRSRLRLALTYGGPIICEVMSPPSQAIVPSVSSVKREDGRMESRPLEDMAPFLPPERLKNLLAF